MLYAARTTEGDGRTLNGAEMAQERPRWPTTNFHKLPHARKIPAGRLAEVERRMLAAESPADFSRALSAEWGCSERTIRSYVVIVRRRLAERAHSRAISPEADAELVRALALETYRIARAGNDKGPDTKGMAAAVRLLAEMTGNVGPRRVEISGPNGGPVQTHAAVVVLPSSTQTVLGSRIESGPFRMSKRYGTVEDRFWRLVDRSGDCWLWVGSVDRYGYGLFRAVNVRSQPTERVRAHRFAYAMAHGVAIPDELVVRHRCDNPGCVRPEHLLLGTTADNVKDRTDRGRSACGDRKWLKTSP